LIVRMNHVTYSSADTVETQFKYGRGSLIRRCALHTHKVAVLKHACILAQIALTKYAIIVSKKRNYATFTKEMSTMKKLLSTISCGRAIVLKAVLALLIATASTYGPNLALAGEEEGAGRAGSYVAESSESTGLPDAITQPETFDVDPSGLSVEMFKGEDEGAGMAGSYAVESSESTGLPDTVTKEESSIFDVIVGIFKGEDEGAGTAGSYAVESSESTGLPDATIWK